jgi:MFS family permease
MTALCTGAALMNATMTVGSTAATLTAGGRLGMAWASVPATAGITGTGLGAITLTWLMRGHSRGRVFLLGYLAAACGAVLGVRAVAAADMLALTTALVLLGIGNAASQLSRYAAAAEYPAAGRGTAIGLVVWAGAAGAVGGPLLLGPVGSLAGVFVLAAACAAGAAVAAAPLGRTPARRRPGENPAPAIEGVRLGALLHAPQARPALASMVTAQVVMVAVMTATPMDMRMHGSGLGPVGMVLSAHTLGMFALSPVTGRLCDRLGARRVMSAGLLTVIASAGLTALVAEHQAWLRACALFLLGYAWNLCFLGGSSHLATRFTEPERTQVEGAVDAVVWTAAAAASLASTAIMAATGYPALAMAACGLAGVITLGLGASRAPAPRRTPACAPFVEAEGRSQVGAIAGGGAGARGSRRPGRQKVGMRPVRGRRGLLASDGEGGQFGEVRRQAQGDDALLLLGVGAGDDGDRHDVAAVDWQVRDAGRHVHEVPGLDDRALQQALAVPDLGLAAHRVDGGLMPSVEVGDAAGARRDRHQVQAQPVRAGRPAGDPVGESDPLPAGVALAGADDHAVAGVRQACRCRCAEGPLPDFAYSEHLVISYP